MIFSNSHMRDRCPQRAALVLLIAFPFGLTLLSACDGGASSTAATSRPFRSVDRVAPPETPPEHGMAAGLRELHPDVAAFVDQFLATCLVGDYARYRTLVSRRQSPESRERFAAIYHAIESVLVESIERVDHELPSVPSPAYLVISAVKVRKDAVKSRAGLNRRIAIIVFKESGEWRMIPAPTDFQPLPDDPSIPTSSAPTTEPTSLPDYPWEDAGDG